MSKETAAKGITWNCAALRNFAPRTPDGIVLVAVTTDPTFFAIFVPDQPGVSQGAVAGWKLHADVVSIQSAGRVAQGNVIAQGGNPVLSQMVQVFWQGVV